MLIAHDIIRVQILHVWGEEGVCKSLPLLIELLKYGRWHSEVVILEGILDSEAYRPLFETAVEEYGCNIFAYDYDPFFEETPLRHRTKPNHLDFGEEDMRRWWREKDYLAYIPETVLAKDISLEDAAEKIYRHVTTGGV